MGSRDWVPDLRKLPADELVRQALFAIFSGSGVLTGITSAFAFIFGDISKYDSLDWSVLVLLSLAVSALTYSSLSIWWHVRKRADRVDTHALITHMRNANKATATSATEEKSADISVAGLADAPYLHWTIREGEEQSGVPSGFKRICIIFDLLSDNFPALGSIEVRYEIYNRSGALLNEAKIFRGNAFNGQKIQCAKLDLAISEDGSKLLYRFFGEEGSDYEELDDRDYLAFWGFVIGENLEDVEDVRYIRRAQTPAEFIAHSLEEPPEFREVGYMGPLRYAN